MQHAFRYLLAFFAALLMPAALLAANVAPANAANSNIEVLNANLGGNPVAGTGLYTNGLAPAGTLLRAMQDRPTLDYVTAQEICENEAAWLSAYSGWVYTFTPMTHEHENTGTEPCANDQKGQAVFSAHGMFWEGTQELGNVDNGKEFRGLCLASKGPGFATETLLVCTAHLWADAAGYDSAFNQAKRNSQAANLMNWLEPSTANSSEHKVILGMDANSVPKTPAIDQIHRVKQNGDINADNKFWEVDQSRLGSWGCSGSATTVCRAGRPTDNSRKIDYLFASQDGMDKHEGGLTAYLVPQSTGVGKSQPHDYMIHGVLNYTNVH